MANDFLVPVIQVLLQGIQINLRLISKPFIKQVKTVFLKTLNDNAAKIKS